MRYFSLLILFAVTLTSPVKGQSLSGSDDPIEITADSTLEWKRADNLFIANENARAVQGDVAISANRLTAKYRETPQSAIEIWQMKANHNVVITSPENTAYGDFAIYNIDQGLATMTGQNLRLVSPKQIITARDKFEYWVNQGRLIATGNAQLEQTNDQGEINTLTGDRIIATLRDNEKGERVLDTLEAENNVVITTPTEIVKGNYAIFNAKTNIAELTGGVTINRGPNILQGDRAQVNMTTNISRLFGGPSSAATGSGGRVRGVFYPGANNNENNNAPAPSQQKDPAAPQENEPKLDQRLLTP